MPLICCGLPLPPGVGKYGCPNCNGDNVNKPHGLKGKPGNRAHGRRKAEIKKSLTIRLTDSDRALLTAQAAAAGRSISEHICALVRLPAVNSSTPATTC